MSTTEDEEKRACIGEQYMSAVGASSLRVDLERRTVADQVIAAGMNPYRFGMALRRLMAEWDGKAKPQPMPTPQIAALAASLDRVPAGQENAGLVREDKDGKVCYRTPQAVALDQAQEWHDHELGLLFMGLKTLPEVRGALVHWADKQGIEGGLHVAAAVLQWWLNPTCPACKGRGLKVVEGTGRTSSKKCKYRSCAAGESPLPHGSNGRRMLAHIKSALAHSAREQVAKKNALKAFKLQVAGASKV